MRRFVCLFLLGLVAVGTLAGTAAAKRDPGDVRQRMDLLSTHPNNATNSDLAFWGKHAFIGYYTGDAGSPAGTPPRGGVRIFDISNPASPTLVKDIAVRRQPERSRSSGIATGTASPTCCSWPSTARWRARSAAHRARLTTTRPAGRACGSSP